MRGEIRGGVIWFGHVDCATLDVVVEMEIKCPYFKS